MMFTNLLIEKFKRKKITRLGISKKLTEINLKNNIDSNLIFKLSILNY